MTSFENFTNMNVKVGEIVQCELLSLGETPAYKLSIFFGKHIGVKKSYAEISDKFFSEDLIGKKVLGIIDFQNNQNNLIDDFISEVLVLGIYLNKGSVLILPQEKVNIGDKIK